MIIEKLSVALKKASVSYKNNIAYIKGKIIAEQYYTSQEQYSVQRAQIFLSDANKIFCAEETERILSKSIPELRVESLTLYLPEQAAAIVQAAYKTLWDAPDSLYGEDKCGLFAGYVLAKVGIEPPKGAAFAPNWQYDERFTYTEGMDGIQPGDLIIWDKPPENVVADHINVYVGNNLVIGGGEYVDGKWVVALLDIDDNFYCPDYSTAFPIGYVRVY